MNSDIGISKINDFFREQFIYKNSMKNHSQFSLFNKKYILCHFMIIILILMSHIIFAAEQYSLLKFNNKYEEIISKETEHPIQILNHDWQLQIENSSYKHNVTIPILFNDDLNKINLKYKFSFPENLHDHSLRVWFLAIEGISLIKINGSIIKEHINSPSSFHVDVPNDLLFKSSDNILEIILIRPKLNEGILNYVHLFKEKILFAV